MFKNSRLRSLKLNSGAKNEGDKQKQKKIISFKEPEIEKSRSHDQLLIAQTSRKTSSVENLTLDDEALSIAKSVGIAFEKPTNAQRLLNKSILTKDSNRTKAFQINTDKTSVRTEPKQTRSMKNLDCIEALSPSITMGCPIIQLNDEACLANEHDVWRQDHDLPKLPTAAHHQIQLLNYHLEQQRQQTQSAMYQIQLLKDQLEAESAARYKSQVHNHKLMTQNRELLDHIQKLFQQVQELEQKVENFERKGNEKETKKDSSLQADCQAMTEFNQRRRSSSGLQAWSTSSSAQNPNYNQIKRTTTTSTQFDHEVEKTNHKDGSRRSSIKDEPSTRQHISSFDTDWRYRRRGSSNFTFCNDRTKEQDTEPISESADTSEGLSKHRLLSTSIPQLKSPVTDSGGPDETQLKNVGNESSGNFKRLQIGESSGTWSRWSDIKPKISSLEVTNSHSTTSIDNPNIASGRYLEFQRPTSKSKDHLKLFN